ncbi:serine/threonine transporter [Pseudobutyrivibrio ruminis]|uniref:Serine/threonine transporter SstT n=1 Tax=Pseudobutyrivibrio ruminis TaxID=46206 RepID=A0A1H7JD69_9FIRM|nr:MULTISPECIES: serine/threonine transporter SstT [Pseudobutyrivibrio]SEK72548.1 serine/threonine transporter [Pseudobutyrivibrio ruminis]SET11129.1 serine/threonine transporter [Pseudobutyrivibrio sp. C4]SFO54804.1 serine/threonine transporter [Pseudobutyrivibrio sp. JW11]
MKLVKAYNSVSLIIRILCGLLIGAVLGLLFDNLQVVSLLGTIFVGALKAVAPVLVFVLVVSALAQGNDKLDRRFGLVIILYMASTFLASVVAVVGSYVFPQTIMLSEAAEADTVPTGVGEVLSNLLVNMVGNPIGAIVDGRYIGILFWAVVLGLASKRVASDNTKKVMEDFANIVSLAVKWIINLAPFGIMGLVYSNVSTNGLAIFTDYGKLLALLVGCMLVVALVIDPLLAAIVLRTNPYPLVFRCLKESGVTAFFTRSSAANIPVNMELCEALGMDKEMYAVSIPLGATINMDGAAITIAVMSLAAANTVGIHVSFATALILAFIATLAACGASGVAGGSLLLIPMACSLFGVNADVAMQVVAVGFIIGVVQDSVETALNSSGDVMFAATAEYSQWKRDGKSLPTFLGGTTKVDI